MCVYSDINECDQSPCSSNEVCQNTAGSYRCSCVKGYQRVGSNCQGNATSQSSLYSKISLSRARKIAQNQGALS